MGVRAVAWCLAGADGGLTGRVAGGNLRSGWIYGGGATNAERDSVRDTDCIDLGVSAGFKDRYAVSFD